MVTDDYRVCWVDREGDDVVGFSSMWRSSGAVLTAVLLAVVTSPQAAMATPKLAATTAERSTHLGTDLRSADASYLFIRNVNSAKVLDVEGGSTAEGASIILWNRDSVGYDNQLWEFDDGYLVNKKSGLCLEAPLTDGQIRPGTPLVQSTRREPPNNSNQRWTYDSQYRLVSAGDRNLVLWGQNGDVQDPGTKAVVDFGNDNDSTQEWTFDQP